MTDLQATSQEYSPNPPATNIMTILRVMVICQDQIIKVKDQGHLQAVEMIGIKPKMLHCPENITHTEITHINRAKEAFQQASMTATWMVTMVTGHTHKRVREIEDGLHHIVVEEVVTEHGHKGLLAIKGGI